MASGRKGQGQKIDDTNVTDGASLALAVRFT
jgi:hypothetical protein